MNCIRPLTAALLVGALAPAAGADTLLKLDARAAVPAPTTGYLKLGTAVSPKGGTLAANSQYLLKDGKPWLPVMGEYHFTRAPASQWDAQLRLMKAAGLWALAQTMNF